MLYRWNSEKSMLHRFGHRLGIYMPSSISPSPDRALQSRSKRPVARQIGKTPSNRQLDPIASSQRTVDRSSHLTSREKYRNSPQAKLTNTPLFSCQSPPLQKLKTKKNLINSLTHNKFMRMPFKSLEKRR
jgi:hypothetical protein